MSAPSRAKRSAVAWPRPRLLPVTSAMRPASGRPPSPPVAACCCSSAMSSTSTLEYAASARLDGCFVAARRIHDVARCTVLQSASSVQPQRLEKRSRARGECRALQRERHGGREVAYGFAGVLGDALALMLDARP